jgi:putative membrane protein
MLSAARCFSEADRKRINECVGAAESKTSAEIVPIVATSSGRYDRAEDLVGLWCGVVLMILTAVFWPAPAVSMESGSWDKDPTLLQAGKSIIAMLVGFMLGVAAGSRISSIRRMLTPSKQMREEVQQSARAIFFDKRIHHTDSGSGLMIYVSLFEHIAVILADQQILNALGQTTLDELCGSLVTQLKQESPTDAICKTIEAAAEKLSAALPRQNGDINELPNSLITID